MHHDLSARRAEIAAGRLRSRDALEESLAAAAAPTCRHAWLALDADTARAAANAADAARRDGGGLPPLAGLALGVKDLFDVAGHPTRAASRALDDAEPAAEDAPAVARLRAAGAALLGRHNMTEFAFSGVGINPHHGTPANAAFADGPARIPGGSTSGGATAVAAGACWAALGSDTGGSIRIPAALQGLVGFKNTARLTPTAGAVPLSTTLDTACAITRSVRDAVVLHEILAARPVALRHRHVATLRLAVPTTLMLDTLEPPVAAAFDRTLALLRDAGARVEKLPLPPLAELASINAQGGFPAAEAWAWHRPLLARRAEVYDPRVALRIRKGEAMGAADFIDLLQTRRAWIARMDAALAPFDAVLAPTVPMLAPPVEPLRDDDALFFRTNAALLRNPSAVNFLDGCALSLPCQRPGDAPVGLMVWSSALRDDAVLDAGLAIEALLQRSAA